MTHTAYNLSLRARLMVMDEESGGDDPDSSPSIGGVKFTTSFYDRQVRYYQFEPYNRSEDDDQVHHHRLAVSCLAHTLCPA